MIGGYVCDPSILAGLNTNPLRVYFHDLLKVGIVNDDFLKHFRVNRKAVNFPPFYWYSWSPFATAISRSFRWACSLFGNLPPVT